MKRRTSLGTLIGAALLSTAALAAATLAGPAQAQTKTYKIGVTQTAAVAPAWLADIYGYYKDAGIDAELVNFRSPTELVPAGLSGALTLMTVGVENPAILAERGTAPWRNIAALLGASAFSIVARPDIMATPGDMKALKGKTVATPGIGRPAAYVLKSLLKEAGLDAENDVTYVEQPPGPEGVAVWEQRKPDFAIVNEPVTSAILARGTAKMFLDLRAGKNGPVSQVPQATITAPAALIASDRANIVKIVGAICKAAKRGRDNPQEAADMLAKRWGADTGADAAVVKAGIIATAPAWTANVAEAPTNAWLNILVGAKVLKSVPKFGDIVETSLAPDWKC